MKRASRSDQWVWGDTMHSRHVILDIETVADETVYPLIGEPEPAANLRDPDKIAADILKKKEAQFAQCSLDPYSGRIVAGGWWADDDDQPTVVCASNTTTEIALLTQMAGVIRDPMSVFAPRRVIGFRIISFDLPWLVTRARLLGVDFPNLDTRKYGNRDVTDLHSLLTFDGNIPEGAFRRTLHNLSRRFGLEVSDASTGADIAQLVREGDWAAVAAHCESDVRLTHALARVAGVIPPVLAEATTSER